MKIIFTLPLFLVFSFFSNDLTAQSKEYISGYMITMKNDTIHGYIKDDKRLDIANQFYFKKEQGGPSKIISTSEALGFYIAPSFYFDNISVMRKGKKKKLFLRKLVSGYINLYQIKNDVKRDYRKEDANAKGESLIDKKNDYLLIKDTGEELLISMKEKVEGIKLKGDVNYFGQIKLFTKDCEDMRVNLKKIKYEYKELSKVVSQYNQCVKPNRISSNLSKGRKLKLNWGVMAGYNFYNINVSGLQRPNKEGNTDGKGLRVGGLVSISYFRKLSIQTGISYNKYLSDYSYTFSLGGGDISHTIENLEIPVNIKYNFSSKKVSPYIIAGIRFGKLLNGTTTDRRIEAGIESNNDYEMNFDRMFGNSIGLGLDIKVNSIINLNLDVSYNYVDMFVLATADTVVKGFVVRGIAFF